MVSYYWWEGEVSRGEEVVMIIKTRATLAERVSTVVKQMHSYSVPAVIVVPARKPWTRTTCDWLTAETEAAPQS